MTAHGDLYRFYGDNDELLYIGRSIHAGRRAAQHRYEKPWWDSVRRMDVTKVPLDDLDDAERAAIRAENPTHNIGPGRPPIGPPVIVRIPPPLLAAVDRAASAAGVSRAEMIRQTLEKAMRL